MKFNRLSKTITFGPTNQINSIAETDAGRSIYSISEDRTPKNQSNHNKDVYLEGHLGRFIQVPNDFSSEISTKDDIRALRMFNPESLKCNEQVKKFRYVICFFALCGLALSIMSRLAFNLSLIEMSKSMPVSDEVDMPIIEVELLPEDNMTLVDNGPNGTDTEVIDYDSELNFDWSKKQVNLLLASFYIGYMPSILMGGGIAEKFGSKYPLFICLFGTAVINLITPAVARCDLYLLVATRIALGLIQGGLMPCLYDLFNKWLTLTETSIFAPMIKVSMPLGALLGTLVPGLLALYDFQWPALFYIAGSLSILWSFIWLYIATSTPQESKYVDSHELNHIMRKKLKPMRTARDKSKQGNSTNESIELTKISKISKLAEVEEEQNSIPWMKIVSNPSVVALTIVKFTYNIDLDFIYLELAVYLREIHNAPMTMISMIASSGYLMQMVLITFVGWIAKNAVRNRLFGFSVTKWRKIFQGGANFSMALVYFAIPMFSDSLEIVSALLLLICFFWMLGAAGESMIPYDLSSKYPASIIGLAHSVSILSGLTVPAVCNLVLGENTKDPALWDRLYMLVGCSSAIGGLIFVLVIKAKPFLPEERNQRERVSVSSMNAF